MIHKVREIPLTQGKVTVVDAGDYNWLTQWKWHTLAVRGYYYAARGITSGDHRVLLLMHRVLLEVPEYLQVDHINHETLDNRRRNLRMCTCQQNSYNRSKNQNNTTGFKGVCRARGRWVAAIRYQRHRHFLGYFETPEQAAYAYNEAAVHYFGNFANLNPV